MKNLRKEALRILQVILVCTAMFTAVSCEKEEAVLQYTNGMFICNEGAFGSDNASISFYGYTTDKINNNIYQTANGTALGDVAQSMNINGDKAYIVMYGSNKVEVVNKLTLKQIGVIPEVGQPRYIEFSGDKAFLTCWEDASVRVIDTKTMKVSKTIPVGSGPGKMLVDGNDLYVLNSGGFGTDSTIMVIDIAKQVVSDTIPAPYNPYDIVKEKNGDIWVLCHGKVVYGQDYAIVEESPSKLIKIDAVSKKVQWSTDLFEKQHPWNLAINDGELFFGGGYGFDGVYSISTANPDNGFKKIINEFAYGLDFNTESKSLYVTVAPNFTGAGKLKKYKTDGTLEAEFEVGIGPNGIAY